MTTTDTSDRNVEGTEETKGEQGKGDKGNAKRYNKKSDYLAAIANAELSEVTKRVYLERWKVMLQELHTDVHSILIHPKKHIAWIKSSYSSLATQKSYMSAVLAMFRHNPGTKEQYAKHYRTWYLAFQGAHEAIDERYRKNEPTQKQVEAYVPFEEIVKKRDGLEKGSDERLLLSLYTYIPPLRCDFNEVRIYEHGAGGNQPAPNRILMRRSRHEATMILTEFKTSGAQSSYEKELPEPLVLELEASLDKDPRDYLFLDRSHKPYRASSFTKWANRTLHRLFGRALTVSLIRHSYINSLDFNRLTVQEKEDIAKDMTHTVGTQDRYRLIFK